MGFPRPLVLYLLTLVSRTAPPRAQSDLKKQLQAHNVRKSIANAILNGIGLSDPDLSSSALSQSRPENVRPATSFSSYRPLESSQRPPSVLSTRSYTNGDPSSKA